MIKISSKSALLAGLCLTLFSCDKEIENDNIDSQQLVVSDANSQGAALEITPFYVGALKPISITNTQARIEFTSSANSKSYIDYGTSNIYGKQIRIEESFEYATHRQYLPNLTPGTIYFYRVTSENKDGERATASSSFRTSGNGLSSYAGPTPFTVRELEPIVLEETAVRIQFTASAKARAYIEYGTDLKYGKRTTGEDSIKYATHQQFIRELSPNTTYYYRVWVTNENWETASASSSFTTSGESDGEEVTPCIAGTNLALKGTIADFSAEQVSTEGYGVANLIDGIDSNRWSADGFPQSAVIDLGATYAVSEINLLPFKDRAYQFLVEGSTSAANADFSILTDATGNTSGGSVITRAFSEKTVRYVKLTITGASGYTGTWSSIADFKIICAGTDDDEEEEECTADSIIPEYRLDGVWSSGLNDLTVDYGTEVMLSMLPDNIGLTITFPDGSVKVGDQDSVVNIGAVTPANNGTYLFTSAEECTATLKLTVKEKENPEGSICMTYAQIKSAGRSENGYDRNPENAYLAEFLFLNPTVSNWTNENGVVCAVNAPEPSSSALKLPTPSGGNDAPAIQAFINANSGADLVGTGTYRFGSQIEIKVPVRIWDMPSIAIGSVQIVYRVNSPDVEMYRSPIDAQNLPSARNGWRVELGADNFVLSTSGLLNVFHKLGSDVSGVQVRGATNFRISSNKFNNLLNDDPTGGTRNCISRAVWCVSEDNVPMGAGYVANNESENIQSNGIRWDGEFYCQQGFTGSLGSVKVIANRMVNAGKRLVKIQHPDAFVASNFYHWRDRQGQLGRRTEEDVFDSQLDGDRHTAVNNRIKIEGEARYRAIFQGAPRSNDYTYTDIHIDYNDFELIDVPPANYYAFGIHFVSKDSTSPDTRNQLVNCSAKNNVWRGPGGTNHLFSFDAGYIDDGKGLDIDISGNVVNTRVLISDFRGSTTTYIP